MILDDPVEGGLGLVESALVVVTEAQEEQRLGPFRALAVGVQEELEALGREGVVAAVVVQDGGVEGPFILGHGRGLWLGGWAASDLRLLAVEPVVQGAGGVLHLPQAVLKIGLEAAVLGAGLGSGLLVG